MSNIRLVEARRFHIPIIANRMRAADKLECSAFGYTPKSALRRQFAASIRAITALVDDRPEAMFGLEVLSAIEGLGSPWMLATDVAYAQGRALVTEGPNIISALADSMYRLQNLVSADNSRAIRMLRRWGFVIEDETVMIGGHPFLSFSMGVR